MYKRLEVKEYLVKAKAFTTADKRSTVPQRASPTETAYTLSYEHGNDSLFYTAVEKDSLIAGFRKLSRSAN